MNATGINKTTPLHVGTSYTHDIGLGIVYISYPPDSMRRVTEPTNCLGFNHRVKDDQKTVNLLSHFHGLIPDTNYKHLECFIMLGTHFETRRCQMSHICDISALSVKCIIVQMYRITYARIINVYINWFNNQKGLGWCPTKQNQANHLIYDILTTVLFLLPLNLIFSSQLLS